MEAIRLQGTVTESGLLLSSPQLNGLLNQKVDIIILPLEDNQTKPEELKKCIGMFDDETTKEFLNALSECRKIDLEGWNEVFD